MKGLGRGQTAQQVGRIFQHPLHAKHDREFQQSAFDRVQTDQSRQSIGVIAQQLRRRGACMSFLCLLMQLSQLHQFTLGIGLVIRLQSMVHSERHCHLAVVQPMCTQCFAVHAQRHQQTQYPKPHNGFARLGTSGSMPGGMGHTYSFRVHNAAHYWSMCDKLCRYEKRQAQAVKETVLAHHIPIRKCNRNAQPSNSWMATMRKTSLGH